MAKIWAKQESSLTDVWLKQDQPVIHPVTLQVSSPMQVHCAHIPKY